MDGHSIADTKREINPEPRRATKVYAGEVENRINFRFFVLGGNVRERRGDSTFLFGIGWGA